MAAENVKVIVRCRPFNKRETDMKCKSVIAMNGCMVQLANPNDKNSPPKQFTFDSVYDMNSTTEALYNDICYPLIESVLEGYNSTVFAYGQTGCGKSFTMEGPNDLAKLENNMIDLINGDNMNSLNNSFSTNSSIRGIIPRAFEHIFEAIAVATDVKYLALVSYLEIYNEQIRDLLMPSDKLNSSNGFQGLGLKEIPNEGVVIQGLSTHPVHNIQECEQLLKLGSKNRMIGATLMNQSSSRSHSIFTISLEQISNATTCNPVSMECSQTIKKGKLNLVDLAGSERQAKTGATGDRLKEATKINLSLSALGNVISALVDGKSKHIPYRDSKLTRLLQDSLGGNTRTLMIACISPADNNYDETLSTLRYANRAKNIHNKPTINEDPKDAMLREYQEEIQKLRKLLESNRLNSSGKDMFDNIENEKEPSILSIDNDSSDVVKNNVINMEEIQNKIESERLRIIQEYQDEMLKIKNEHENEKSEKEILMKQMQELREQYQNDMNKVNKELEQKVAEKNNRKIVPKEEILKRLQTLKDSMIGGEKANDKELKEKRKRKKMASEKRLNALANVLSRVEQDEDRELLQDQYKDITQELNLKTEALRKYRHKVKALETEISDIQSEFETERTDYLETIRKHERNIKLLTQISEKIVPQLKNDCNYRDLESIKEQAVWIDDLQKWKLPELSINRTKLPPAGKGCWSTGSNTSHSSGSGPSTPASPVHAHNVTNGDDETHKQKKLEQSEKEDLAGNYFKPRRATQLLNQSHQVQEASKAFSTWKEYTNRSKSQTNDSYYGNGGTNVQHFSAPVLNNGWSGFNGITNLNGLSNLWINGGRSSPDLIPRRPIRLEALPMIEKRKKSKFVNTLDVI